ncbi:DNA-binding response regulator [Pedobacter yulinensis]|uniref:DNA-binding response regulator n=1 Tax=Pedobacter yulinensis TaxID=2126353 RepID=A0A2T3HMP3_9SPHI|nr:response regulator transcription factor [Pedobacter yulinensis]PST83732.1 DNA-binding response regulator [Pedobacter yulinensis]
MINILLAEDHSIVRNGIKVLLETQSDFRVQAEAKDGLEALEMVRSGLSPDLVLADVNMPGMDGIELLRELKKLNASCRFVFLTMVESRESVAQAFREGADGYLLKNIDSDELVFSLRIIQKGTRYLCSELSSVLIDRLLSRDFPVSAEPAIEFSSREIEILNLIADGHTNVEMADALFISKRTIEGHRQSLLDKTGSKNTAALIRFAVTNGYIT